jgi:dolichol kinase
MELPSSNNMFGKVLIMMTLMFITSFGLFWNSYYYDEGKHVWFSYNPDLFWVLPIMIASNILIWTTTAMIRWRAMDYLEFTEDEKLLVVQERRKFNIDEFTEKYSKFHLKIIDGLCRKSNHIFTSIFNLLFITSWVEDETLKYQSAVLAQVINITVSYLTLDSNNIISYPLYGSSSRIRDGKLGRLNLFIVRCASLATIISVGSFMIFYRPLFTDDERNLLIGIIYIPTALGDAAGEIFGSLFGKHEFKVYGLGEINKKSIEGTLAVFLFSFVPMCLITSIRGESFYILSLIISLQSTFLELVSFRSTDNFILPVGNVLTIYLLKYYRTNVF